MAVALRGAAKARSGLRLPRLLVLRRNLSESNAVKNGVDPTVTDCSEFGKWRNGGGICHASASIDPTARVEVGAIVHSESMIGAGVCVGSGAVVGPSVSIGQLTKIGYNVSLSNCSVGESCVIHNGVCIGQDGFGFFVDDEGRMLKKPQVGEIGHNVVIGKCCMLCGQVGIAGSVTMGDYVTLGGRVAVRDHISIASKVRLAGNSCVVKDIKESGDYGGFPANGSLTGEWDQISLDTMIVNKIFSAEARRSAEFQRFAECRRTTELTKVSKARRVPTAEKSRTVNCRLLSRSD
ncbi:hypothetical protein QJS10_CPA09g01266 [Acorus calamus]|uniref:Uncharacterized protein n=1 Tax=Acorus calamus TaxID=4465 RepID=A0AAV9E6M6_ACOCL|nr:hypothetical protein QJS10_CPA09g01266 [Acorus calamus]